MKALLLGAAVLATVACSTEPAAVVVREHQMSAEPEVVPTASGSADPTTTATTEPPTTTTAAPTTTVAPEPVTTAPVRTTTTEATARPRRVTPTTTEAPSPQSRTVRQGEGPWSALAECESGGANVDTGNGYSGYFQFSDGTWRSLGYSGRAVDYSYATQVEAAQALQARSGWGQWPACSARLGLS